MSVEQIFRELSAHVLEGVMFHVEMADYYTFLDLRKYAEEHEEHAKSEMTSYRCLCLYYMNHYNQFIEESQFANPGAIPQLWRTYKKQDIDSSAKKQAVKSGVEKWVAWETETKELYQRLYEELENYGDFTAARHVLDLASDVDYELAEAQHKQLALASVDYDLVYIMEQN